MTHRYTTGKNIALFLIISAAFFQLHAQPHISWQRSYGTTYDDYATRLFEDPAGNIIMLGSEVHQDFTGIPRPYMVIVKLDANGQEIWKQYHDVAFNTFNPPVDYYFGKHFFTHEFGEDVINLVLNINGRTMMYKVLEESGVFYYAEDIASPVIELVTENEKVYAYEFCSVMQSCYGPDSLVVQRFDPTPDSIIFDPVKWTYELKQNIRTAPIQGHYDFDVQDIRVDVEENVYLLVQIERWDFQFCTDCADAFVDAWNEVFKINAAGELILHKRLDVTTAVVSSMGFVQFDNGEMVVRIDDINAGGTALETSLYMVNTSLEIEGSLNLHKQYPFIELTPENEFVVMSNSFDPNDPLSLGLTDIVLSRLDADGGLIWSRHVGGSGYDFSKGLLTRGDNIVMLANTDSGDHDVAVSNGFTDIWLVNFSLEPLSAGGDERPGPLVFYPNPASDWVSLQGVDDVHLGIYTITGKLIREEELSSGTMEISGLPEGMYVMKCIDGDGVIRVGKLVISR